MRNNTYYATNMLSVANHEAPILHEPKMCAQTFSTGQFKSA